MSLTRPANPALPGTSGAEDSQVRGSGDVAKINLPNYNHMSNNTCILHTACNAHRVLHRLKDIADSLAQKYRDIDLPYHAGSTSYGELYLTEFSHSNTQIPLKISQQGDRKLLVEIVAPSEDDSEKLRSALTPLVLAYLTVHTNLGDLISQQYETKK